MAVRWASWSDRWTVVAGHVATAIANARAYEEERKRADALAELDRAKTAFFSNISHEFRTPLTLILGPVQDILAKGPEEVLSDNRELLTVVHRNGLRLQKLVNTLLDFARIEAGRTEAVYEETDLAVFTVELASVFRSAIEKAGLKLIIECPPLPEPVYVDREMWEKIVFNLLSNAFKFTFEGEIEVALRWRRERVELSVRDTGVGITTDELPRIFERFHRVPNVRSRTYEGTGIGLALVQELARLHGGDATVQSTFGRGSTFTVTIKTGTAHLPKERIGAARTMVSTAVGASPFIEEAMQWLPIEKDEGGRMKDEFPNEDSIHQSKIQNQKSKILVADDNADMREYARRLLLQQAKKEIEERARVETALREREERYELVLAGAEAAIWDWDVPAKRVAFSPRWKELRGLSDAEVGDREEEWTSRIHPDDFERVMAAVRNHFEGRTPVFAEEYRVRHKDGRWIWILDRGIARRDTAGRVIRMAGSETDITERKRAEESLAQAMRQKEALYQLVERRQRAKSLEEIYETTLDAILLALRCERASILLGDDSGVMRFVAWRGLSDGYRKSTEGHSPWKNEEPNPQPICISDVAASDLDDSLKAVVTGEGIRALAFIPLVINKRLAGKFMIYYNAAHAFSEEELDLSLTIAEQTDRGEPYCH